MKRKIRTPYFEIGTKNYIYGDKVLEYAKAADAAAEKYDIDVLFICPAVEIRNVVQNTKNLIVLAPYMDTLRPGRGMADVLPEALKAAGAVGVVVNHCLYHKSRLQLTEQMRLIFLFLHVRIQLPKLKRLLSFTLI